MIKRDELMQLHNDTCNRCYEIMSAKNMDYADGDDPLKNFRLATLEGLMPEQGIMLRVQDKMQRIRAFINRGNLVVPGEGVVDAVEDIINYMILLKALITEDEYGQTDL